MEQFKIRQDGFKEIRKVLLIKLLPNLLIVILGVLAFKYFTTNWQQTDIKSLLFTVLLWLGILAFGIYWSIKRQKRIFDSYVLTIDDASITREQYNTPKITILKDDIREIIKNSIGGFIIKGDSNANMIMVVSQIENYDKLEELLAQIRPISIKTSESFYYKFRFLISILVLGLMAAVYTLQNKIIVGVSGIALLIFFTYSIFVIQRDKNIDNNTKRGFWVIIILVLSIIVTMYFKLIA